jgi:Dopey, N-terminal
LVLAESLSKDKAFRRYAAGVERALGLFDTTLQEWADYISFLSRLHKALQNHPDGISTIPRKVIVAKRLAQCLHPSLPSGVHQKALEVYGFIFAFIGVGGLTNDLGVYLPGIASTLTFASISVRPLFLSLVEEYVLKVPTAALRPALKAVILALLPGLEDETSEEFERTLQTLNRCKRAFSFAGVGEVFWQNLFLASITSPSRRHGIVAYLDRYLPKLGKAGSGSIDSAEDEDSKNAEIAALTTPEPGLLLRCFAAGLADEQALVQRAFLDLLVSHLPLHASIFRKQVAAEDLELLISAAVGVVLRRDMSLNRRLWSWFMGPELVQKAKSESMQSLPDTLTASDKQAGVDSPDVASYFQTYCAQALIRTLEVMITHESRVPSNVSRPFRIALSLMDRWEIGSPVVNAIFLPLIRRLRKFQDNAMSQQDFDEVFRSANVFFDGVESIVIWSKMLGLVVPTGKAREDILADLDLAGFIIANFNVGEEEMVMLQIPLVCLAMLDSLSPSERAGSDGHSHLHDREVRFNMFHILTCLIDMIPDRAFASGSSAFPESQPHWARECELDAVQAQVKSFFERNQDAVELSEPPFSAEGLGKLLLSLLTPMILTQIAIDAEGSDLSRQIRLFSLLLEKLPCHDGLDAATLIEALKQRLAVSNKPAGYLHFAMISAATALCISFFENGLEDQVIQFDDVAGIVPMLVWHLWTFLSFHSPQHHIEAVRLLNDLQRFVWREELVTSTISKLMVEADASSNESYRPSKDGLERFATLWTHSRSEIKITGSESNAVADSARGRAIDAPVQSTAAFSSMLNRSMVFVLSVLREPHTEVYNRCCDWLQSIADLSRCEWAHVSVEAYR